MRKQSTQTSKYKVWGIVLIWVLLFFIRVVYLDADLPSWGKVNYQPIDEGAYSYLALNQINYGQINPDLDVDAVEQFTGPHVRTNFMGNLFSYIGLKTLGDNYYGLRMGSVICMLLNSTLIFAILYQLKKNYFTEKTNKSKNILLIMLYILFEFTFVIASRVNETSIYRMFFLLLCIYISQKYKDSFVVRFGAIGFIGMFSVVGIYITNLFLVVAGGAMIFMVFLLKGAKKGIKSAVSFFLGSALAYVVGDIYYRIFWDTTLFQNTLTTLSAFSTVGEYESVSTWFSIVRTITEFLSNNFNLYNAGVFLLFLFGIPKTIKWMFSKRELEIFYLYFILGALFFQTLFSEDFIRRKFIIIVPILYFLIYISTTIEDECMGKVKKLAFIFYLGFCTIGVELLVIFRLYIVHDNTRADFTNMDTKMVLFANTIIIISALFFQLCYFKKKVKSTRLFFAIAFSLSVGLNIYMSYTNIYKQPTFTEKEIMVKLDTVNMKEPYVVGTYMLGYSLYNNCIPVLNTYEGMRKTLENSPELYYLDYAINSQGMQTYIDSVMEGTKYRLKCIKEFPREFQTFGEKRTIALYKVVTK